jgi:hypothetical protein
VISGTRIRLTTLDLISAAMDAPSRRLDFTIVLHFASLPERAALEAGAASARLEYPTSGASLDGASWRLGAPAGSAMRFETVSVEEERRRTSELANERWDLRQTAPVRQLALSQASGPGGSLVTRFHHAVCDGLGALLWLEHQLAVVSGRDPRTTPAAPAPPALRSHRSPAGRSAFAFRGPADRLQTSGEPPSGHRAWRTVTIEMQPLQQVAGGAGGVTYGDLLATCALETFHLWNSRRDPTRSTRIGLWIPINIRAQPLEGFGNGSSRIRVYRRWSPTASVADRSRGVRRQIEWSRDRGEWAVPELRALTRLPLAISRPLLRAYFNRPWVDMATGAFSHLERSPLDGPAFAGVARAELIGTLDKRHPLGLYALSRAGMTSLTFVHDPARLGDDDLSELISLYQGQLALALGTQPG